MGPLCWTLLSVTRISDKHLYWGPSSLRLDPSFVPSFLSVISLLDRSTGGYDHESEGSVKTPQNTLFWVLTTDRSVSVNRDPETWGDQVPPGVRK